MADKERNALIPLPSGGLENIGSGPKSILSGMVSDALALARVREKLPDRIIIYTKEEWMRINPFMTEAEAEELAKMPPFKKSDQPQEPPHDYPMDEILEN
ncbi:hypothetical protein [Polaromonas glacialis]|uniref:hypothetical protein n=1 Tax=Polaromonas glacialis TaxID=866564 RepID=UPI000497F1F2|nr:hypothetical protein [Polaromonas glacialis]